MSWLDSLLPYVKQLLPPPHQFANATGGAVGHADPSTVGLYDYQQNLDQINWAEKAWAGYYVWVGEPILATALLIFVWHEVRRCLPFALFLAPV